MKVVADTMIWVSYLSAKADYLVTADKEILRVHTVQDVRIISIQTFEALLKP